MMNYFVGIVLCIAIVNAEAIPEALTLGPVQNFLYQKATETSKFLKSQQGLLQTNVPAFPNVLPQVPLKPDLQPTSSTTPVPKPKPVEPKAPNVLPQVPLKSDLKQTPSATPDVSPKGLTAPVPMSMVPPLPMPSEPNVVPQGLTTPLPNPKVAIPSLPLPAKSKPPVVPTIPSPEVDAAKARAISLYGKEPGFVSVTDRVMKTRDGQRFLYINIKGDGNCGFYAIGVDRARFVNAIEDLVNVQHDVFQDFFKGRQALVRDIDNIMLPDDKTAIEARVRTIAAKADNGGDITSALKLLTDFATEKTAYHTELFVDARNRLIANLQKLEDLSKVRSNSELGAQVGTLVALLTSAESIDSINVDDLTRQYTELVTSLTQAGVNVKQVQDAFKELITCKYGDVELFEKGKSR